MGAIHAIILENSAIHGINSAMDRKHINRGFKKLRVRTPARRVAPTPRRARRRFTLCFGVEYIRQFFFTKKSSCQ